ncbi:MAG TPA: elongation factor P [bacterium]|nr:elongation factor P [bacterium]HPN43633.1 elongation factor P [bacterium]
MASTSDFRSGLIIKMDGELFTIVEFQHVKMGRGGAFVRTKIKNLQTGKVLERTFRSGEKVEDVRVERRPMQFLYREGDILTCMDNETFEQLSLDINLFQSGIDYLKDGETISILMNGDTPIGAEMPNFVVLKVTSTDPGFRGDTVSGATKRAVLESGGTVLVPLFVEEGDVLKIDTRTGVYIERVK